MIDFGLWGKLSEGNVAGMIYAGAKSLDELKPSNEIIRLIGDSNEPRSVLDFGCGVGRNLIGMSKAWKLFGYDSEPMILITAKYIFDHNDDIKLFYNWERIRQIALKEKFDTIFCCYVLQHIPEPQLRWYLDQFKEVGKELFVFGRRAIDPTNTGTGYDGRNKFVSVWKIIFDCGYKISEAQEGFTLEGNGNDHHWVRFKHETARRVDTDTQHTQQRRDDDQLDASRRQRESA